MRITVFPHAINKDLDDRFLAPNMVRHKRNMRSGGSDSDNVGVCENIRGNVKIHNPHVNQVVSKFTIITESIPEGGGTTMGGGTYSSGQTAIITATAASGYRFVNWTEGLDIVSTTGEYAFAVNRSRVLTANFVIVNSVYIVVVNDPIDAGQTISIPSYTFTDSTGHWFIVSGSNMSMVETQPNVFIKFVSTGSVAAPHDNNIVTIMQRYGQTFPSAPTKEFNPDINRLRWLLSPIGYTSSQYDTVLSLSTVLENVVSVDLGSSGTYYQDSFTLNYNEGPNFLYLIWDLRDNSI